MRALVVAACLVISFPALASDPGSAPASSTAGAIDWAKQADLALASVKPQMQLTDAQVGQLRPLLAAYLPKLRALFDSYAGKKVESGSALIAQFREAREAFRKSIDPILDDTQMQKFLVLREQADAEIRKEFIEARLAWYRHTIGVDDAQTEKIRPILSDQFDQQVRIMGWNDNPPVTNPPVAKPAATPATGKGADAELLKVQQETDARLRAVLTPQQMRTYMEEVNRKVGGAS